MLSLRLLGAPEVRVEDAEIAETLLNKDLALLFYLAVTGQPQPRSSLSVLLWGDANDIAARANLRKALSTLHQVFGSYIDITRDKVGVIPTLCAVDTWAFERQVQEGLATTNLQRLQTAAGQYQGDFLTGFTVHNAPDFDLWLFQTRERLRGLAVRALSTLALHCEQSGRSADAVTYLQRVLAMEPWNEEAHCSLMTAFATLGQRSAALQQYQTCVDSLASELGVEPDTNTRQLYEHILAGNFQPRATTTLSAAATTASPQATQPQPLGLMLPSELTPIVGRDHELAELGELLAQPDCRLISIVGPGGIGKSRLALALAMRQREVFDTIGFVSLETVDQAQDLLPAVESALHPTLARTNPGFGHGLTLTGRTLVILDGCEHLVPDAIPVVEALLTESPKLSCVVTTREALDTPWEWRYDLEELSYPMSLDDNLRHGEYGAVQLFLQIARRTRPRLAIQRAELPQVVRICQLVGGMPLGIEFAAAQVGRLPLSLIADQVETRLDTLQDTLHESTGRQRSLRASFDASWRTLTPGEQRVLAALSAVRGEFTLDAALEIADATIADILRLTDKSLLRLNSADRYSLHEIIRHFGEQYLAEIAGSQESVLRRYHAYYLRQVAGGATAILARAAAQADPIQYAHNLVQHLRVIWRQVVDQPSAEATAMAVNEAEWAHGTLQLRAAIDTFELMEGARNNAQTVQAQQRDSVVCDVIWLPGLQDEIQDITPYFGAEQSQLLPILAETCCIESRLVALPYVLDLGLLYYRRDLLEKYGFAHPPRTWAELAHVAAEIQHRERAAGRTDFWGFIWQGHVSERLVCNALEWQHADGGGVIIEPTGVVSINNCRAQAAIERARSWIGAISPRDTHTFDEPKVVQTWVARNAAFMRIWAMPIRMWADPVLTFEDSKIADVTGVTLLPCGVVRHAATLGGWPLAIRRGGRDTGAAIKLIKALASPEAQRRRALLSDPYLPTQYALYHDPTISATYPLVNEVRFLIECDGFAVRPAKVAGKLYPQVSSAYGKAVAKILYDGADAAEALAALEQQLVALGGWPVQRRCEAVAGTPRILPN